MIDVRFKISNIFGGNSFHSILLKKIDITTKKVLELEIFRYSLDLISFEFNTDWNTLRNDGPYIQINLLSFAVRVMIYEKVATLYTLDRDWSKNDYN